MSDETKREILALRSALVLLCWNLVDDQARCTCEYAGDEIEKMCPACEAFGAIGLGTWPDETIPEKPGYQRAAKILAQVKP
jgi:hypothetical protein